MKLIIHFHLGPNLRMSGSVSPLPSWETRPEDVRRTGVIDPLNLKLGTTWRSVVSFTARPLYTQGRTRRWISFIYAILTNALVRLYKKVKVSRDRPRWPKGFRYVKAPDFLDFRHYEGGKVVTIMHRPSLPPGVFLVLIFRGWVDPRAHGSLGRYGKNPQWHPRGSIPRPSD
jgi:hypothetical protein